MNENQNPNGLEDAASNVVEELKDTVDTVQETTEEMVEEIVSEAETASEAETTETTEAAETEAVETEAVETEETETEEMEDTDEAAGETEDAVSEDGDILETSAEEAAREAEEEAKKKRHAVWMEVLDWVKSIAIALVIVVIIRTFLFTMIRVDGTSMLETLQNGDRIAATIIDLKIQGPQRGQIVICTYPGADHLCIKRVIGMPGDKLQIISGKTYINDEEIDEPYVTHPRLKDYYGPIVLGEDEYFVMGDNRAVSHDSRAGDVGPLKKSEINGNARLRLWPLNKMGLVK